MKEIQEVERKSMAAQDSIAKSKLEADTLPEFVMPKYDEQAIQLQQQQMMLNQMSPEQRAAYIQQYQAYMQQMAMQEELIRQQQEYERKMQENGGVPPVSDKMQSKIEQLKQEYERKRIQDSIANAKKIPSGTDF